MHKIIDNKYFIILFCLIISFIGITICSECSFLYPMNYWVDANAFFTVGKSMLHNLVPYLDLFEQKGPLLYLIYMIGAIISEKSFIGVYFLEIISYSVTLYYISKIICLYLDKKYIYLILPLFLSIILTSKYFSYGGSAEGFILPFLSISLYHFLVYLEKNILDNKTIFIDGLMAGIVFLIKYNVLGFWIGYILTIIVIKLKDKEIKELCKKIIFFVIGMLIPIIITIICFVFNNGLDAFIDDYFITNIALYASSNSILTKIYYLIINVLNTMIINKKILILTIFGIGYFLFKNKKVNYKYFFLLITFILLITGIYIGGRHYTYYYFDVTIYSVFGIISFFLIFKRIINKKIFYLLLLFISIFSFIYLFKSPNYYFTKYKKEDLVQYKFARIINQKRDATILNYRFLDGGFYFASNTIPNTRFFMRQNIACKYFEENCTVQDEVLKNKGVDFVIIRKKPNEVIKRKILLKNYKLIMTDGFEEYEYELYEKK